MAKILSKFGEQQLVMVNCACGFNQSEPGKYFEWKILNLETLQQGHLISGNSKCTCIRAWVSANNWSVWHWQITISCDNRVQK